MIVDLKAMAEKYAPQVYEIHSWEPGEMMEVRLTRPSLYNMARMGLVPNPLMGAMQAMFSADPKRVDAVDAKKQGDCVIAMAKYALVEPTYQQITDAGLTLTDQQLTDIYMFALGGAAALAAFRAPDRGQPVCDGGDVAHAAQQDPAH